MKSNIENIKPIQNHIIFQFLDITAGGVFTRKSESGIIQVSSLKDQAGPRFGKVLKVGPEVSKDINVGDTVLIESGKWTTQFWLDDGTKIWKTDDKQIIAISTGIDN